MTWIRTRAADATENPLALLRLAAGMVLLAASVVALLLALAGAGWKGVQLAGACWAIYGLATGGITLLDEAVEGIARALQNAGLMRAGGEFSEVEAMAAQGRYGEAVDALLERARDPRDRVEATLRRAALLAVPLGTPDLAVQSLLDLRDTAPISARSDLLIGLALVDLYEHRLADPGAAMGELRRLIDRHPGTRRQRELRTALAALKHEHFGDHPSSGSRTPP